MLTRLSLVAAKGQLISLTTAAAQSFATLDVFPQLIGEHDALHLSRYLLVPHRFFADGYSRGK